MNKIVGLNTAATKLGQPISATDAWRPDIDGLRAIAVVPVVIFHVAQSVLHGGYVGVDIFFVISGYLISKNIFEGALSNRFSILGFYERRLRRIFPAYGAVLIFTLAMSLWLDLPPTAAESARTILAAIASVTNVYFWSTADYFTLPAEQMPLLHTWSLSVEEQFYLLFPALVVLALKRGRARLLLFVFGVLIVSLLLSSRMAFSNPAATFYLLPTRAWELLLGSVLALQVTPPLKTGLARNLTSIVGLALIAASMVILSPLTPFPGLAAVPPCLGAALLIYSGDGGRTVVSTLLSLRPVTFIGLISYSLYLWHWPLLVLQKTHFTFGSKLTDRLVVLILSFVFATLSWWFIERPTRNRQLVPTRKLVSGSAIAAVGLLVVASIVVISGGAAWRFSPDAVKMSRYVDYDQTDQFREGRCFLAAKDSFNKFDKSFCLPNKPGRTDYILLGDSHAAHLAYGLRQVLPNANILQITAVQCPPLVARQPTIGRACPELIDLALNQLPKERSIKKVLLSAEWNRGTAKPMAGWNEAWLSDLKATVSAFAERGIEAVIVGPSHEFSSSLPSLLARGIEDNDPSLAQRSLAQGPFELDRLMSRFAAENGLKYISVIDALCVDQKCPEYAQPGVPIFFDGGHFIADGSVLVAQKIADQIR